jgi:hypothetical protein
MLDGHYEVIILIAYVILFLLFYQVAVGFVKECGALLQDITPLGLHGEASNSKLKSLLAYVSILIKILYW